MSKANYDRQKLIEHRNGNITSTCPGSPNVFLNKNRDDLWSLRVYGQETQEITHIGEMLEKIPMIPNTEKLRQHVFGMLIDIVGDMMGYTVIDLDTEINWLSDEEIAENSLSFK